MRRLHVASVTAALVLCAAVASSGVFGPGPNSIVIPSTGQTLSVAITAPADGAVLPIPPGTVQLQGSCAVGTVAGQAVNVLYVVDVSGSTDLNFLLQNNRPRVDANGNGVVGDAGDDFNGDGEAGDILDGEIAGVLALHASIGNPATVNVGIVAFASNASAADVDPALPNSGGISQVYTNPPQADRDGAGGVDVEQVLRSLDSDFTNPAGGQIGLFTPVSQANLGSGTEFPDALTRVNAALALFPSGTNLVFFLSDGESNAGFRCYQGACGSQLTTAIAAGTVINTVGVGAAADPVDLQYIASQTGGTFTQVTDPSDLSTTLPFLIPAGLDHAEVDGQPVFLDAIGNFTTAITCVDETPFTVTATCFADDPDSTSVSADVMVACELLCGNGVVDAGVGEECDPPGTATCDAACQRVPLCGDGFVDAPEVCDPPDGVACDLDCSLIVCGNGSLEPGEECEPPGTGTCDAGCQRVPLCGDGFTDAPEQCDPPDGTTCDALCRTIVCGNGIVQPGEECDPPAPGVCSGACQRVPLCGDGFVDAPETCDPPDGVTCTATCHTIVCGDGQVQGVEECDPPDGITCDAGCVAIPCPDPDGDGVCLPVDNCPDDANSAQTDSDGDGIGDVCDPCTDTDGDGAGDPGFPANTCPVDICPEIADPDQADFDGDGLGDVCDEEDDTLNVYLLKLKRSKSLDKQNGLLIARGDFIVPPPLAIVDFFNANQGISFRIEDALFVDESAIWHPEECESRFREIGGEVLLRRINCKAPDRSTKAVFKPLNKNPGAVRFIVKIRRRQIDLPFQEPVKVTLTSIGVLNRVGSIVDCETKAAGLKCRE